MPLINWVLLSIASAVTLYIQVLTYAQLTNKEIIKINLVNIIIFIIAGIFVTYNTYTNINLLRPLASYSLLITIEFILFKDSFVNTIVRGSLCYIIAIFVEIFVGVILILLKLEAIDSNLLFKILL